MANKSSTDPGGRGPLAMAIAASLALVCTSASAQSVGSGKELPDYAALLGKPALATGAAGTPGRKLDAVEVERAAARLGIQRTRDQRRRAAGANRMLQQMPATVEASVAGRKASRQGSMRLVSLQELPVTYGRIGPNGRMHATHDPAETAADDRAR